MNHRPFEPGQDADALAVFHCSTGSGFEDDAERWINQDAVSWLNDLPFATFRRRNLHLVEDDDRAAVAVYAWQDITRIDLDGIWLEVLAVSVDHQHRGVGRSVLIDAMTLIANAPHDGEVIAGLVHPDNIRSHDMLIDNGWELTGEMDEHHLMVGRLNQPLPQPNPAGS